MGDIPISIVSDLLNKTKDSSFSDALKEAMASYLEIYKKEKISEVLKPSDSSGVTTEVSETIILQDSNKSIIWDNIKIAGALTLFTSLTFLIIGIIKNKNE